MKKILTIMAAMMVFCMSTAFAAEAELDLRDYMPRETVAQIVKLEQGKQDAYLSEVACSRTRDREKNQDFFYLVTCGTSPNSERGDLKPGWSGVRAVLAEKKQVVAFDIYNGRPVDSSSVILTTNTEGVSITGRTGSSKIAMLPGKQSVKTEWGTIKNCIAMKVWNERDPGWMVEYFAPNYGMVLAEGYDKDGNKTGATNNLVRVRMITSAESQALNDYLKENNCK